MTLYLKALAGLSLTRKKGKDRKPPLCPQASSFFGPCSGFSKIHNNQVDCHRNLSEFVHLSDSLFGLNKPFQVLNSHYATKTQPVRTQTSFVNPFSVFRLSEASGF
jgi:hypothetical protein